MPHAENRRDGPDPELAGHVGIAVDIDLGQHELAAILMGQLLEDRAEHPAGAAPWRPEIDDNGDGRGSLEDLSNKGLRSHVDDMRLGLGRWRSLAHGRWFPDELTLVP